MLRFFAKFQRSRNLVLFAFCLLLLVGLVIFYIPNTPLDPTGQFSVTSEDDEIVIAKVGSQEIKLGQFRSQLQAMALQFGRGNSLPLTAMKSLGMDKQVLDQLINNRLLLDQAEQLNLTGTDREIAEIVKAQFTDNDGKFIGAEEYKRRLRLQGGDVEKFETEQRNNISAQKVRNYLIAAQNVTDREIEERFKRDNTKVDVTYAVVDLEKVRKNYQPTEQDLKSYYDSHQGEFKADQPTRKVDYIFISTDDVAKIVPVTDEELRQEYETRKQFEYRASVIKLNVLTPDDEQTVREKINDLNRRVRGGQGVPPEDFAAVARGNSQDPSKSNGGDLGWIKKEPNKSADWRQRPYTNSLKVGDLDGPFRDGQSWYILKVTEQREVPFAQMRDTLRATVSNNKAFQKASQLADLAYEKATEFNDLRKAAEELSKQLKVSPDALLKSTPYFKNGDPLPDLGKGAGFASNPAFEEAVSTLKKGEIGDKVSIPGGQAVPRLADLIENGQQLTFDQARNQVEDKVRREQEPNLAKARAQEILSQAKTPADLERIAKAQGLEVKTDTNFNNYTFPGAAGGLSQASYQARSMLLELKEGEVAKAPMKVGTSYLIFGATKRVEADLSKLSVERSAIRSSLLSERQNAATEAVLKTLRAQYEKDGKLTVYQKELDKFFSRMGTAPQQ